VPLPGASQAETGPPEARNRKTSKVQARHAECRRSHIQNGALGMKTTASWALAVQMYDFHAQTENYEKSRSIVMLILTRRVGETIIIDDDIEVTVLAVKGNQVRLGIKAPDHIAVHREEIYQRLMGDNPGNHSVNE